MKFDSVTGQARRRDADSEIHAEGCRPRHAALEEQRTAGPLRVLWAGVVWFGGVPGAAMNTDLGSTLARNHQ